MARSRIIVHLDSGVVMIIMRIVKVKKDEKEASNMIAARYLVKISQPVCGETSAVLASRFGYEPMQYVSPIKRLTGKLTFASNPHPPATIAAMKLAIELNEYIGDVKGTDSLALAVALLDKDASVFYTTDSVLLGDRVKQFIDKFVARGGRDSTLKVLDLFE